MTVVADKSDKPSNARGRLAILGRSCHMWLQREQHCCLGTLAVLLHDFEDDDEISYNILTFEHNRISMTSDFYFKKYTESCNSKYQFVFSFSSSAISGIEMSQNKE